MELETSTKNNYYFQLILKDLAWKQQPCPPQLYFTVNRGRQIFEFTKPAVPNWNPQQRASLYLKLNFVVINYSPSKDEYFSVKAISPTSDQTIAMDTLDCNAFIDHFIKTKEGSFAVKLHLGQHELESEVYVGQSRVSVEKAVREEHREGLAMIEQRPKETRSNELEREPNRYRRTPSPTRRQIQEIIARRKSPRRQQDQQQGIQINSCQLEKQVESKEEKQVESKEENQIECKEEKHVEGKEEKQVEGKEEKQVEGKEEKLVEGKEEKQIECKEEKQVEGKEEKQIKKDIENKEESVGANPKESSQKEEGQGKVEVRSVPERADPTQVKEQTPQRSVPEKEKTTSPVQEFGKPETSENGAPSKQDSSLNRMLGTPKVLIPVVVLVLMVVLLGINWPSNRPKVEKKKGAHHATTVSKGKKARKGGKGMQ